MQTPVRFYISQSDDQPVVRTIPVARPSVVTSDAPVVEPRVEHASAPRDERVTERVRQAILRRTPTVSK